MEIRRRGFFTFSVAPAPFSPSSLPGSSSSSRAQSSKLRPSRSAQQGKERKTARGTQKERRKDKTKDAARMPGAGRRTKRQRRRKKRKREKGSYRVSDKIHRCSNPFSLSLSRVSSFFLAAEVYTSCPFLHRLVSP